MIHFLLLAVASILPSQAQNLETHPCISETRRNEIFAEYQKKNQDAKLTENAQNLLKVLYQNADRSIIEKIARRGSLNTAENISFNKAAMKSVKASLPSHTHCDEDKNECTEFTFGNRKTYSVRYSDHDNVLSVCTKHEIHVPVNGRGISGEQFHPSFEPKTCLFVRDGKIEETLESVEVIYPYNDLVTPPGNMYWKPKDPNLISSLAANDAHYCEQRARRLDEASSVNSTGRGNEESKDSGTTQKSSVERNGKRE